MASDVATFSQFSSLPNEIKLQVIETTNPEDIENLSLSCKAVYTLARKTLKQHKTDKNWQSHLHFEVNWRQQDAKLLEAFHKVRHIATNRRLARYLKTVFIQCCSRDRYPPTPLPEPSIKDGVIQACRTIFKDFESPYIKKDELDTLHQKLIDHGTAVNPKDIESATLRSLLLNFLLLNFLPNLERLSLNWLEQWTGIADTIRTISTINRDPPESMRDRLSLTKLQEIDLDYRGDIHDDDNSVLEASMTLPSLRILRFSCLSPRYTINEWLDPTPHPSVSEVHFSYSNIRVTQLARLLDHVKCLRVFSYDHDDHSLRDPIEREFGPGAFLDLVLQRASTSLTYLNYTTFVRRNPRGAIIRMGPVGSFQGFVTLKTLRLSCAILLGDVGANISKKLVDELPPSLEELELVEHITLEEAQALFAGVLEMKQERLPNLRYVVFEGAIPFDEETVKAYEGAGLILDWRIQDLASTRYRKLYKTDRWWVGGIPYLRLHIP